MGKICSCVHKKEGLDEIDTERLNNLSIKLVIVVKIIKSNQKVLSVIKRIQSILRGIKTRKEIRSIRNRGKMKFISNQVDASYNYTDKKLIVLLH